MKALIPCKTVSVRLPEKNYLDLGGKPLWRWSYDWAVAEGLEPVVLFHGPGADAYPSDIPVMRSNEVLPLQDALCLMAKDCADDDYALLLQVTNPFRRQGLSHLFDGLTGDRAVLTKCMKTLNGRQQYETGLLYRFRMRVMRGDPVHWPTLWYGADYASVDDLTHRELVNIDTGTDLAIARQLLTQERVDR